MISIDCHLNMFKTSKSKVLSCDFLYRERFHIWFFEQLRHDCLFYGSKANPALLVAALFGKSSCSVNSSEKNVSSRIKATSGTYYVVKKM